MFRLLGVIVGIGLAVWAGLAWLDPQQASQMNDQLHQQADTAIASIATAKPQIAQTVATAIEPAAPVARLIQAASEPETIESSEEAVVATTPDDLAEVLTIPIAQEPTDWQVFWAPFRSRAAAEGFANRLSQQIGVELSVLSGQNGQHQVSFAYQDEADRERIMALIEQATGVTVTVP
jgi:hypothetical protein